MALLYTTDLINSANLIGYWRLEGNSNDSKNSNNGTDGTITYGTSYGYYGQGALFNGNSSTIGQAASTNVNITGDISIVLWIKPTNFTAASSPIHKDSQYSFQIAATTGYVAWADSSNWSYANFADQNIGLTTGVWQHLAFTKTGGAVKIYYNGILKVNKTGFGGSLTSTTNIMRFGCYCNATVCVSSYFAGAMDEIGIFDRAITQAEVNTLAMGAQPSDAITIVDSPTITLSTLPFYVNTQRKIKELIIRG